MHVADMGMVQLRQGQGLTAETLEIFLRRITAGADGLEGDKALQKRIPGLVDLTHAAHPRKSLDAKTPNYPARLQELVGRCGGKGGAGYVVRRQWVHGGLGLGRE